MKKTFSTVETTAELHTISETYEEIITTLEEGSCFEMHLSVEDSGIFRQGWNPDELEAVTVIVKRQPDVENGTLAVVFLKSSPIALLRRVYKSDSGIVLEAPKNLDHPNEIIPPVVLSGEEAEEVLTTLGKVVQFRIAFK